MVKTITLRILAGIGFIIIVPTLTLLSIGFLLGSIAAVAGGVLRTYGLDFLKMSLWPGTEVPVDYSIPVAIAGATVLVLLAFGSWKLMKGYLRLVKRVKAPVVR